MLSISVKTMMAFLLAALLVGDAQTSYPKFTAFRESTKSAAAEVITVQLPKDSVKRAEFLDISIWSSATIDVTIEINGSAATATSFQPYPLNNRSAGAVATPYHGSNSTAGQVIDKFTLDSGSTLWLDISDIVLSNGMTTPQNIVIRTTAFTGTARFKVTWQER
jgi:hypothetical protein